MGKMLTKNRRLRFLSAFLLLFALAPGLLFLSQPSRAQDNEASLQQSAHSAASLPTELNQQEIASLVDILENETERNQFLNTLKSLLAVQEANKQPAESHTGLVSSAIGSLGDLTSAFDYGAVRQTALSLYEWGYRQVTQPENYMAWGLGIAVVVGAYLAAWTALLIGNWVLRKPLARIRGTKPQTWPIRLLSAGALLGLQALPIGFYVLAGYATALISNLNPLATAIALFLLLATGADRLLTTICRVLFLPANPQLSLLPIQESVGAYFFVWIRRFGRVAIYGFFVITGLRSSNLDETPINLVQKSFGIALALLLIMFILQNRQSVKQFFQKDDWKERLQPPVALVIARFGDLWHFPAIAIVVAGLGIWLLEIEGGLEYLVKGIFLSTLCLLAARIVDVLVGRGLDRMMTIDPEVIRRNPLIEERANRYLPTIRKGFIFSIYAFASIFVLQSWGVDLIGWFASDTGQHILATVTSIFITLILAVLFWEAVSAVIDSQISQLRSRQDDSRAKRLMTLLPLLRRILLVLVITASAVVSLSEIGLNIAPVLAGLGIFGIAVGLASQKLIQDFLNGVLVLIDNSLAVGDKVTLAGRTGIVEDISIRNVTIRHPDGPLYVIPFSEVDVVENMSRDFMFAISELTVDSANDIDEVLQTLRDASLRWNDDPAFAEHLLAPVEIRGVNGFDEGDIELVVAAKVRPGSVIPFRRKLNHAIQKALADAGITHPRRYLLMEGSELAHSGTITKLTRTV